MAARMKGAWLRVGITTLSRGAERVTGCTEVALRPDQAAAQRRPGAPTRHAIFAHKVNPTPYTRGAVAPSMSWLNSSSDGHRVGVHPSGAGGLTSLPEPRPPSRTQHYKSHDSVIRRVTTPLSTVQFTPNQRSATVEAP
jgi:hypothetical protein